MYVAEQGTQHGDSKPMNCQSFVREDIKVRRRFENSMASYFAH